jgi:hypothetical protein
VTPRPEDIIADGLAQSGLDLEEVGPGVWMTSLAGQWKRTIPVLLRIEDRSLHVESLLCRAPDEGHERVYRYLLTRNQRPSPLRFALDDDGDIVMVGWLPLVALDEVTFDRLLGLLLTTADEVFNAVLRRGFGSYIAAEQEWRAANDLPPNPVSGASE